MVYQREGVASVHPRSKLAVRSPVRPSGSEWLGRSALGRPLRFAVAANVPPREAVEHPTASGL